MPEHNEPTYATAQVPFRTLAHFYDPDDPTPESSRELSDRAEEQIFHTVLDSRKGTHKEISDRIEITLPASDLTPDRKTAIVSAIHSHFRIRAEEVQRSTRLTQRVGLREFRLTTAVCIPSFIGIALCTPFKGDPLVEVIENVLVIFCWVTIWQPFQSIVFDRWTQSVKAKVYREIAKMDISVRAA